jgi:hypothetical protein
MNAEIKKAKLKDSLFLEVEYSERTEEGGRNVKEDRTAPVHDDLKKLYRRLTIHLGLLCQQVYEMHGGDNSFRADYNPERTLILLDPELQYEFTEEDWNILDLMTCTGFTIGGSGDSEGVTLIGRR